MCVNLSVRRCVRVCTHLSSSPWAKRLTCSDSCSVDGRGMGGGARNTGWGGGGGGGGCVGSGAACVLDSSVTVASGGEAAV